MTLWLDMTKGAWMAEIREVGGLWACTAEVGEMPLAKGLRLTLEAAALGRETDAVCEVVGWQYRVSKKEDGLAAATLEITVLEVEEPGLIESAVARVGEGVAKLSGETRFFGAIVTAILVTATLAGTIYTLRLQPDHGLVFVGRHVRSAGGWLIGLLFIWVLVRSRSFAKPFFGALLTLTGFVVWGCWMGFSALPAHFGGTGPEYVAYAKGLGTAFSKSYWPIVVAALPWLSVSAKIFGMERTGKIAESLEKGAGRKEKE